MGAHQFQPTLVPEPRPITRLHQLPEDCFISILQACELIGVSRRTIYNWLQIPGRLVVKRTAGRAIRIQISSLYREFHGVSK